jgi:hypothetical protein
MEIVSDKENPSPDKDQRQARLIITVLAAGSFTLLLVMLTIAVLLIKQSNSPRQAILRGSDGVLAGATKQDLEKVVKVSEQWAGTYVRESFRGASQGDFTEARENVLQAAYPIYELLAAGRIARLPSETECLVLKSSRSICKVSITEGPHKDRTYWVYKKCVVRKR